MVRLCGQNELAAPGLPVEVEARVRKHPCFSEGASHQYARLHLPVAPACNIQCNYCNRRYDCVGEGRPGVASRLLSPHEAVTQAVEVAQRLPDLSVVGFAGPGDPLANPDATLTTLEGVRRALPDVMLCVATNGLALPDHVEELADVGVGHVTVTLNAIDPSVGERIHPWIVVEGARRRGREAAAILLERQLHGIRLAVEYGMLVKINTVLIPGVNDAQIGWISRVVRKLGAFVHNVMPLLVAPAYETHYSKIGQRGPGREELERARASCEGMRVMRHCRGCRADAVGRLGDRRPAVAVAASEEVG